MAETRLKAGDISLADKSQIEIAAGRLELAAKAAETAASANNWSPPTKDGLCGSPVRSK